MIRKLQTNTLHNRKWLIAFIAMIFVPVALVGFGRLFARESGYWLNLFTEALGVYVSVILFVLITKWVSDRNLRRSLITQMRSTDKSTALNAVNELKARGWTDLEDEILVLANLQGADLSGFNLQGCDLSSANLRHSFLVGTDLRGACLLHADLTNAILEYKQKEWTVEILKAALKIHSDALLDDFLARIGFNRESYLELLIVTTNSRVKMDEGTIMPDGSQYHESKVLAFYTDDNYPSGKFIPNEGLKTIV